MATTPGQLALQLSVARWKKFPNDSIEKELNEAHEWIKEAALMNRFLPDPVFKAGFGWQAVHPIEIKAAKIKLVQQYADFMAAHINPLVLPAGMATAAVAAAATRTAGIASTASTASATSTQGAHVPDSDATLRFFAAGSGLDESDLAALKTKEN